jgi:hypothetical protein
MNAEAFLLRKNVIDRAALRAENNSSNPRSRSSKRSADTSLAQSGIDNFVVRTQKVTGKAHDDKLNAGLLWIVTAGLSFHVVEHPHFVQWISELAPTYNNVAGVHAFQHNAVPVVPLLSQLQVPMLSG